VLEATTGHAAVYVVAGGWRHGAYVRVARRRHDPSVGRKSVLEPLITIIISPMLGFARITPLQDHAVTDRQFPRKYPLRGIPMLGFVSSECKTLFSAMLAFVSIAPESALRRTITRILFS
jgi:hypothetical protein